MESNLTVIWVSPQTLSIDLDVTTDTDDRDPLTVDPEPRPAISRKHTSMKTHRNHSVLGMMHSRGTSNTNWPRSGIINWNVDVLTRRAADDEVLPRRTADVRRTGTDVTIGTDFGTDITAWNSGEHEMPLPVWHSRLQLKRHATTTTSIPGEKSAVFHRSMITRERSTSLGGIHSFVQSQHRFYPRHSLRNVPRVLRSMSEVSDERNLWTKYKSQLSHTAMSPTMTYAPARVLSETANSETATYEFPGDHGPICL